MMAGEWGFAMHAGFEGCAGERIHHVPINLDKDNNIMQGLALRLFKSRQKQQPVEDTALLAAIGGGSQAAMEALYRQYHPRLFRFLSVNVYDRDAIEEVINDTMHVVWQTSQQFRGESKVSTWIFGIAWRKSIAANQTTRKHRAVELDEADVASMQWQDQTQQSQLMQRVLAQLSPAHRAVVELTYYGGFSYQEIAGIVGCPENTVKTRMFYARRHLQQLMGEDVPSAGRPVKGTHHLEDA